jgi:hypothetical protein
MALTFYWDILPLLLGSLLNFCLGAYALTKGGEPAARTFGWMSLALVSLLQHFLYVPVARI